MIIGDKIGLTVVISIILSFILVASTGYVLHSIFTFHAPLGVTRFVRYGVAVSANIPLAFITVWFWHEYIGLAMIWASPIATIFMVGSNFIFSRWAILPKVGRPS